jgi:pimeloyl-ACP methyl ester carboxylesterase
LVERRWTPSSRSGESIIDNGRARLAHHWPVSETDFHEDLKNFDVPTLILHVDDKQIVPIGASALDGRAAYSPRPAGMLEPRLKTFSVDRALLSS